MYLNRIQIGIHAIESAELCVSTQVCKYTSMQELKYVKTRGEAAKKNTNGCAIKALTPPPSSLMAVRMGVGMAEGKLVSI